MSSETVNSHAVTAHWRHAGAVSLAGKGYQLAMPRDLPSVPGIYRIEAEGFREIYVGEGSNLIRRLGDYQNAGWKPDIYSRTNRQIQSWIYQGLNTQKSTFHIYICTSAEFASDGTSSTPLNLNQKYFRALVEASTIAHCRDWTIVNKQYDRAL